MRLSEAFNEQGRLAKVIDLRELLDLERQYAETLEKQMGRNDAAVQFVTRPLICALAYVHNDAVFRENRHFAKGSRLVTGRGMQWLYKREEELQASLGGREQYGIEALVRVSQLQNFDDCTDHRVKYNRLKQG